MSKGMAALTAVVEHLILTFNTISNESHRFQFVFHAPIRLKQLTYVFRSSNFVQLLQLKRNNRAFILFFSNYS